MEQIKSMNMKTKTIAAAALIVVATAGYAAASWVRSPEVVAVSSMGCANAATATSFGVPLRTVGSAAPGVPLSFGPLDYESAGGLIRLAFDGQSDGRGREIVMAGDSLLLPTTFGRDKVSPKEIRITCRDGAITTVRYNRGRTSTTFNVTRQEMPLESGEVGQSDS